MCRSFLREIIEASRRDEDNNMTVKDFKGKKGVMDGSWKQ